VSGHAVGSGNAVTSAVTDAGSRAPGAVWSSLQPSRAPALRWVASAWPGIVGDSVKLFPLFFKAELIRLDEQFPHQSGQLLG